MSTQSAFCSLARAFLLMLVLGLLPWLVACTPKVSPDDVYHYVADCPAEGAARDIAVWSETDGSVHIRGLTDNATFPAVVLLSSSGLTEPVVCIENPGSRNIRVIIKDAGYTTYAGLRFTQEVVVNIWDNGIVEVDREGIEATDRSGVVWVSRKARINDKQAIIFVKKP